MTPPVKSRGFPLPWKRLTGDQYIKFNIAIAGVITMILLYSGFFSPDRDNYPVACIHERLTGEACASCGLSHSFSLIVRGRIVEAYQWNLNGPRVFIFFAGQLIMRVFFSAFYLNHPSSGRELVIYDAVVSFMLFIVCFLPLIRAVFRIV